MSSVSWLPTASIPAIALAARWNPAPPPRASSSGRPASSSAHSSSAACRLARAQRVVQQLGDRAQPPVGVGKLGLDPEAGGSEDALLEHLGRRVGPAVAPRRRRGPDSGPARPAPPCQRQRGLHVERADLDRSETRVRSQLPPEPRVVGDVGGARQQPADSRKSSKSRIARGTPERGQPRIVTSRAEASPVSRPWRNGEFAASACSSGRWRRRPLKTRIAVSASGIPTWMCRPPTGVRRRPRAARGCARSAPCR